MEFNLESTTEEERFALLFGIMLGDGCLSRCLSNNREYCSVVITGNFYNDRDFFKNILVPLIVYFRGKDVKIKERKKYGSIEINFCDKKLFTKIKSFGFPIGKKGTKITIPKIFYDKDLIKYIVQGFFATDGSLVLTKNPNKFYPRIEIHAIAKNLILQTHSYLTNLGMTGHFYKCKRNKQDLRWKVVQQRYRFQFNGKQNLLLFNDLIGFVNPKHKIKFHNFLKYSDEYDRITKGLPFKEQYFVRKEINSNFRK